MDSAFEYLFMRRPSIDYISPAICEAAFSSSSGPTIVLNDITGLTSITGLVLGTPGHPHRLAWNRYPGVLCYSVYKLVDELDPNGDYQLIAECISDNFYDPDEPGTYKITAITPDGETPFGEPFSVVFAEEPPEDEVTIEALGLDNVYDFSDDAGVAAGDLGGFAAFWKDGSITTPTIPGNTFGYCNAVSPDGVWITGQIDDGVNSGDVVSYNTSTNTLRDLGFDFYTGLDVNTSGLIALASGPRLIDAITGALVSDCAPSAPGDATVIDSNNPTQPVLNDANQVTFTGITLSKAYRWTGGVAVDIRPPDWFGYVSPNSATHIINELGHCVHTYTQITSGFGEHGTFFYDGASSASIGNFGAGTVHAWAMSPNDDWVAGHAFSAGVQKAFRWHPDVPIELLPELSGALPTDTGAATDVNDDGWIVGFMQVSGVYKAFVYRDGVTEDLAALIPAGNPEWTSLESAVFINNQKQVIGRGTKDGIPNTWFIMQLT